MKRAITSVAVVLTSVLVLSTCTSVNPKKDLPTPERNPSSLMEAASKGDADTVQALLAKGADVNAKDNNGATALMLAKNKEIVRILKEARAKE